MLRLRSIQEIYLVVIREGNVINADRYLHEKGYFLKTMVVENNCFIFSIVNHNLKFSCVSYFKNNTGVSFV